MMIWLSSLCPFLLLFWHLLGLDRAKVRIKIFSSHRIVIVQSSCSARKNAEKKTAALVVNDASMRTAMDKAQLQASDSCRAASLQSKGCNDFTLTQEGDTTATAARRPLQVTQLSPPCYSWGHTLFSQLLVMSLPTSAFTNYYCCCTSNCIPLLIFLLLL